VNRLKPYQGNMKRWYQPPGEPALIARGRCLNNTQQYITKYRRTRTEYYIYIYTYTVYIDVIFIFNDNEAVDLLFYTFIINAYLMHHIF
jgi:hypothetical protein